MSSPKKKFKSIRPVPPDIIPLDIGTIRGSIMTFKNANDILAMHKHGIHDCHITIVARGRFTVRGDNIPETIVEAGAVLDWEVDQNHEFVALEDNSRIINIVKNPRA